jgi:hypothetical protein
MRRFDRQTLQEWQDSPLTAVFLQFLRDQQEALARKWAAGSPFPPATRSEEQVMARLLGELADLEWADYATFYDLEAPKEDA